MGNDLTQFTGPVKTIEDVVNALVGIRDHSALDIIAPRIDGISAFSRLYATITQNVLDTVGGRKPKRSFRDPDFLTRLDLEFARRYLAAIRGYEARDGSMPASWGVLFDRRRDQHIGHVNYAAAGVNAHVNFDLAFALLETWKDFPPNKDRRSDYDQVNNIFAEEMDALREDFGAFLAEEPPDGGLLDRFGNVASDLVVRATRSLAWDAAERVWGHYDKSKNNGGRAYQNAYAHELRNLDRTTHMLGWMILKSPGLP